MCNFKLFCINNVDHAGCSDFFFMRQEMLLRRIYNIMKEKKKQQKNPTKNKKKNKTKQKTTSNAWGQIK